MRSNIASWDKEIKFSGATGYFCLPSVVKRVLSDKSREMYCILSLIIDFHGDNYFDRYCLLYHSWYETKVYLYVV